MMGKSALLGLAVGLAMSASAMADDTDVFFSTATGIRPNILFILDNSGSMSNEVDTVPPAFNPAMTYTGPYSQSAIYFERGGNLYSISNAVNQCADITARLAASGRVLSYRMVRKNSRGSWVQLKRENVTTAAECQADAPDLIGNWGTIDQHDFYSANYLNWQATYSDVTRTRLEVVQQVVNSLVDSMTGVNVGLMTFNLDSDEEGGRVLLPVENVDTVRNAFKAAVNALTPETWTPLSETLFGAMRYYRGDAPFLDQNPRASTVSGGKYVSPITHACQTNAVVLLTDGEPTRDENHNGTIEKQVGTCTENCLDEIAAYLQTQDQCPTQEGIQSVRVYTVGFETDQVLLSETARKGGGQYFLASNASELDDAFSSIVRSVMQVNATFVSPGVAVNTFNRLNHLDALYFSVFQPELKNTWSGNLKRYRLGPSGSLQDANNPPRDAIDPSTGFFKQTARSWWSLEVDGADARLGGAASQHPTNHGDRKVFTYYPGSGSTQLAHPVNAVSVSNEANLPKSMFGIDQYTTDQHRAHINWIRGADVDNPEIAMQTRSRKFIADPLHSVPQLVVYGGTEISPDVTVFFGDNQGFLHAVNGNTGETYFSFLHADFMKNQKRIRDNEDVDSSSGRVYGLDGAPTAWVKDANRDGQISAASGDSVYLYTGMRRGGRHYYTLDVTSRTDPRWLWKIAGGSGDFVELGETWSKPVKTRVTIGTTVRDVLIFSGGYDPNQDDTAVRAEDEQGRAIYMVDALTGTRLWWAGPVGSGATLELSDMKYSIPATPRVIDVTGDGLADQIYVGDMGGQVWRFDLYNGSALNALATGGVIARLSGTDEANARRFYQTPDVFGLKHDGSRILALVIGSGWTETPMSKSVDDRIYMLRMEDVSNPPTVLVNDAPVIRYTALTEASLYDATANLIGQGSATQKTAAAQALDASNGWYVRLVRDGEKVASSAQTVGGEVFITSYEPTVVEDSCIPAAGTPRLYHLNAKDATPVLNYDKVGTDTALTAPDRFKQLLTPGLPPTPQRMRINGYDVICVGAECTAISSLTGMIDTYWYEE